LDETGFNNQIFPKYAYDLKGSDNTLIPA